MYHTYGKVKELLKLSKDAPEFDYQEEAGALFGTFAKYYHDGGSYKSNLFDYESDFYKSNNYEVVFNGENGKEEYYDCSACSMEEAIGMWLMEYPDMCFTKNFVDCYTW